MATLTKSTDGATHELKDLEVFELSLVDRPANKKPFLIVKSENREMPTGSELIQDESGNLTKAEAGFSSSRKKKIKDAIAYAAKTLGSLAEKIDSENDEEAFLQRVSSAVGPLGNMGKKPAAPTDEEKTDAKKEEVAPVGEASPPTLPAPSNEKLTALEKEIQATLDHSLEEARTQAQKANAERIAKMQAQLDSLTSATHALTRVVKMTSSGARPASQAAPTGETPTIQKQDSDLWKPDMNSPDFGPDEQL